MAGSSLAANPLVRGRMEGFTQHVNSEAIAALAAEAGVGAAPVKAPNRR